MLLKIMNIFIHLSYIFLFFNIISLAATPLERLRVGRGLKLNPYTTFVFSFSREIYLERMMAPSFKEGINLPRIHRSYIVKKNHRLSGQQDPSV